MPSDAIKLKLVNQSADSNDSKILIFQKNVVTELEEIAVAWQVIQNLGNGWNHPFTYSYGLQVGAVDSDGNDAPPQTTDEGQLWTVGRDASGHQIQKTGPANSPSEVQIANGLDRGAISACVYRDGKLLATKTGVAPGQKAVFAFKPTLYVAVVSQIEEGDVIDAAIISTVNTEYSLLGIASADIVLTGGGPGRSSLPFSFSLQNVVFA